MTFYQFGPKLSLTEGIIISVVLSSFTHRVTVLNRASITSSCPVTECWHYFIWLFVITHGLKAKEDRVLRQIFATLFINNIRFFTVLFSQ